jgi:F-type H+-transporting ATPase subunit a
LAYVSLASPSGSVLASNPGFHAPGPADFDLRTIFSGSSDGAGVLLTKASLLLIVAAVVVFAFLRITSRKAAVVPSKGQYFGEEAYNFVRNGIARDSIGSHDFMKFVPLLVTVFFFILVNNLFGLIPIIQFAPFSRASFAYGMAAMIWILYNSVGIARHGFFGYLRRQTVPSGVPVWILPLLIPLEFLSNILIRPVTLSLRLFANMFAGHLLLLLFATGGEYMLIHATGPEYILKPAGIVSFIMGVLVGFLELVVSILQAYVFTLLTAQYVSGALADEH